MQTYVIRCQTSVLKETREFQKVIFKSLSNEHSFHDLCTALYKIMGISIAILDTNYHLLEYSDDFSWPEFTEHLHLNPPRNWKTLGETSQDSKNIIESIIVFNQNRIKQLDEIKSIHSKELNFLKEENKELKRAVFEANENIKKVDNLVININKELSKKLKIIVDNQNAGMTGKKQTFE